ncbi:YihY/virulence factor BrkB family protein [Hahella sp. SMD15-11]|uniref:YihY/virulence factor BrkB family protein n=1 Tax=Thermohahella caldifontis TaxID=3142973 RepID=A0AB39UW67_9GAMM
MSVEVLKQRLDYWLWEKPRSAMTAGEMRLRQVARVLYAVIRDATTGRLTLHAMGLVYTTLLSIVPLLALSFSVLKAMGAHKQLEPLLYSFFEPFGDQGVEIVQNILSFVDNMKVGVLGSVGLGMLIYTVISLVQKVERSFNEIWHVSRLRPFAQRFSSYLSVIVIGPVLVVSALGATATLVSSAFVKELIAIEPFGWAFSVLTRMMPYLMIIGLFTFVYVFIPNARVRLRHALTGGLIAGILWQTTGYGFTTFVVNSSKYEAIYSGFAVGILLLIWLYLSWLILLLGASISYYAQNVTQITPMDRQEAPPALLQRAGWLLLHRVAQQVDSTGGGVSFTELEAALALPPEEVQFLVRLLMDARILASVDASDEALILARSPDKVQLMELYDIINGQALSHPTGQMPCPDVDALTSAIHEAVRDRLGTATLADWVRGSVRFELKPGLPPLSLDDDTATDKAAGGEA